MLKGAAVKRKLVSVEAGDMGALATRLVLKSGVSALEMSCIKAAGDGNSNMVMETAMEFAKGEGAKVNVTDLLKAANMQSVDGTIIDVNNNRSIII